MQKRSENLKLLMLRSQEAYSVRVHERREGSKHEIMATRPSKLFLLFIVI
jgi:hypothetical protein